MPAVHTTVAASMVSPEASRTPSRSIPGDHDAGPGLDACASSAVAITARASVPMFEPIWGSRSARITRGEAIPAARILPGSSHAASIPVSPGADHHRGPACRMIGVMNRQPGDMGIQRRAAVIGIDIVAAEANPGLGTALPAASTRPS